MKKFILLLFVVQLSFAQNYWQQHVEYEMDINMDVSDFTFDGEQRLVYTNNSPDTITKVYYHLFFITIMDLPFCVGYNLGATAAAYPLGVI